MALVPKDGNSLPNLTRSAFITPLQSATGEKTLVRARKGVIVSRYAYSSPAILLRLEVGPKQEVQELGLESQFDHSGVGKNLMDHPGSCI